jgi:hypothetical protein
VTVGSRRRYRRGRTRDLRAGEGRRKRRRADRSADGRRWKSAPLLNTRPKIGE